MYLKMYMLYVYVYGGKERIINLILFKNCFVLIKKMFIDCIELCGMVLNKCLKVFIEKEGRYCFEKIYYIVDF